MQLQIALVVLAIAATGRTSAIPTKDNHKDRVVDKKLSDEKHFAGEEHNADFDHEAFLGKEEAKTFDELSPEESKERLGKIVDKMDKDNDGKVTEEELKNWIKHVQNRYIMADTERQWKDLEGRKEGGGPLTWEVYKASIYGHMEESDMDTYASMLTRDEKRFKKADANGDGELSKEEYSHFLHPEDAPHMRDVVIDETLEDIDKDKDGFISLEEYIGDMWPEKEGEEPEWVKTEREQFSQYRDKNNDGKMDRDEVRDWIIPEDYDHSEAEARHLMHEADEDKDGFLTKEEILEKHELFVGSQATDYGEALMKHEEL